MLIQLYITDAYFNQDGTYPKQIGDDHGLEPKLGTDQTPPFSQMQTFTQTTKLELVLCPIIQR